MFLYEVYSSDSWRLISVLFLCKCGNLIQVNRLALWVDGWFAWALPIGQASTKSYLRIYLSWTPTLCRRRNKPPPPPTPPEFGANSQTVVTGGYTVCLSPRQDFSRALVRILEIFSLHSAQGSPECCIFAGLFQFCKLTSQMKPFDEFCLFALFVVQGWAELSLGLFFVFQLLRYWQ